MTDAAPVEFVLDGAHASALGDGRSLLDALRGLGVRSVKDGCSPQGQCGCCTVWVDGQPRVACVTPLARVAGRQVTTIDGLDEAVLWSERMCATGGSQCGFCTPGIVMRLAAIPAAGRSDSVVRRALLAHLCRCTGWNTIVEAACNPPSPQPRDRAAAAHRAALEGRASQVVGAQVAVGEGGFAADTAPADALVALRRADGEWVAAPSLAEARHAVGKVQGRRTTEPIRWPLELPDGDWVRTLRTTWVDPAYLEPDAAWCLPGGEPVGPAGNGGAFGAKRTSEVADAARRLADRFGRSVLAMYTREDVVRLGGKRPPIAAGVRLDGTGVIRVARTAGIGDRIRSMAPSLTVEEFDVVGPPTNADVRGAGWVEAAVLLAPDDGWVTSPEGGRARAVVDADGAVRVWVRCGAPLDEVVLHSYCVGAAHMALGWVRYEGLVVDESGTPLDLTIRSFGVIRAIDTPSIIVEIEPSDDEPVNGSDAVFAAVSLAAWRASGFAPQWPTMRS
jgi:aerobic-type carbon monoxide dehydrogenase small subunit (CoxS/CutS family)